MSAQALGGAAAKPHSLVVSELEDEDSDGVRVHEGLLRQLPTQWTPLEHAVGLYSNSEAAPIVPLIAHAKTNVDVEIYEMEDQDVLAALLSAARRGVVVRIIKDPKPIGQKCDPFAKVMPESCASLALWLREFKAAKGVLKPFLRKTLCGEKAKNCFEHGKLISIDGQIAAISTGNFNTTNLCDLKFSPPKCNRDYTYISRDREVLKGLREVFAGDWNGDASKLPIILAHGQLPHKLTVSPFAMKSLTDFILSAKQILLIQTQYITDEELASAILDVKAHNPKLRVQINLSDLCEYGSISEAKRYKAHLMFQAFADAGIQLRMFPKGLKVHGKRGYLHAKAIVVDAKRAWIGSVNGSTTSLKRNREFGIYFSQATRVKELAQQLDEDFNHPKSITWQKSVLECRAKKGRDVQPEL